VVVTEAELRPEVAEAVCALLYAGWLMGNDVPELKELNKQFTAKYGVPYAQEVVNSKEKYLNHRLLRMLTSTQVPDPSVVEMYLCEIAKAYGVEWKPRPAASAQPYSSTIGMPLPLPGMPVGDTPGAPPAAGLLVAPMPMTAQPETATATINFGALPGSAASAATPLVFNVALVKGAHGFGMTLDPENVVQLVKPDSEAERSGMIQEGDRVLALNGTAVSYELPVKSVAIDLDDGAIANFSLMRIAPPAESHTHLAPSHTAAVVAQPSTVAVLPAVDASSVAAVPAAPLQPAVLAVAAPVESEDDALLRRLEQLKRS